MSSFFLKCVYKISRLFPQKEHPFNASDRGVYNLNYFDFEYKHTAQLLDMYKQKVDIQKVLSGKYVLDVGCGAGGKAGYIAEKYNAKVEGIDINDEFLKQGKQNLEKRAIIGVTLSNQSALELDFPDNHFDVIIMSDVLEHIPNTEKLFQEIHRVLKRGGYVLFDFAPYYHYYGHHMWDVVPMPWIHVIFPESFLVSLYKYAASKKPDGQKRITLKIGVNSQGKESFTYLNHLSRKKFENIISQYDNKYSVFNVSYYMLKKMKFFSYLPIFRELMIRHIVGVLKKK